MSAISPTKDLNELSNRLGYTFKQPELLLEAFRHSSYVNELSNSDLRDNERLEFLGDAVLDLAICAGLHRSWNWESISCWAGERN